MPRQVAASFNNFVELTVLFSKDFVATCWTGCPGMFTSKAIDSYSDRYTRMRNGPEVQLANTWSRRCAAPDSTSLMQSVLDHSILSYIPVQLRFCELGSPVCDPQLRRLP